VKWVGLAIVLAGIYPLAEWLRRNPRQAPKAWMLLGLMPFLMTVAHLVMAFTSLDGDPLHYYVHGAEFSVLDGLAIALYFSMPQRRHSLPFLYAMLLYFFAASLSTLQAIYPMATLFYIWQLARMFLVYAVVARGCADPRVPSAILTGMAAGLFLQVIFVIWERFGQGVPQANGTFDHQNILGLISHFVVFPFFALLLAGRGGRLPAAIVLSGVTVELLTASRGTIVLSVFAYVMVFVFSALRRWNSRKARALLIGVSALAVLAPVALTFIQVRGQDELASSDETRDAMQDAAKILISGHPLGVGANNYVLAANIDGANVAAGLVWTNNSIFVHNTYLLVTAETGYFGLISFLFLLIRPITVALLCGWRERQDPRGDLLLGLGVALLTASLHAAFEWVFILDLTQYMLAIEFGMVAGLAGQLGYWRTPYAQRVPARDGRLSIGPKSGTESFRHAGKQNVLR
jgi:O-antigen ligase